MIGERLRTAGEDVVLTGHLRAGGLASAAAVASDLEADTFNAAGWTAPPPPAIKARMARYWTADGEKKPR